jgi:hypothetical protein
MRNDEKSQNKGVFFIKELFSIKTAVNYFIQ